MPMKPPCTLASSPAIWHRSLATVFSVLLPLLPMSLPVAAQAAGVVEVRLEPNQTIRELAERHLGDPDLWPEILKATNIATVADITADTTLQVPADAIAAADRAIGRSGGQIQKANIAGAQIFAPDEIGRAISLHDKALDWRLLHDWVA